MSDGTRPEFPFSVEGILSRPSPFSVQETLERFQTGIQKRNLHLFAHINHSAEAAQVGLKMQEAHVLIFGNPQAGTPLMIASPLFALELPLKVLIWQREDGQVWVSYSDSSYFKERYALPPELIGNIAAVDRLVEQTLQS